VKLLNCKFGTKIEWLLNTIGTYFSWSRRAEAHKISSIQFAKLYRFLAIEMSLPRNERMNPSDLLKYTKEQYDRLSEISPLIPPEIIEEFRNKFKHIKDITMPEETNGLHAIYIFDRTEEMPQIKLTPPLTPAPTPK
jgi:hypothetical protein